jgi:hypothetical protein
MADLLRRAIDATVAYELPEDRLIELIGELAPVVEAIEAASPMIRRDRTRPELSAHPQDFFATSPLAGHENPLSPPIRIWAAEVDGKKRIRGRANFPLVYEGPPTCVHGGVISEMFDEILGDANLLNETPGMTGTLSIRYRKPTPILRDLELEAWVEQVDGRKITTKGSITVDGEITAEAEGLFIFVDPLKMLAFAEANAKHAGGDVLGETMAKLVTGEIPLPEGLA